MGERFGARDGIEADRRATLESAEQAGIPWPALAGSLGRLIAGSDGPALPLVERLLALHRANHTDPMTALSDAIGTTEDRGRWAARLSQRIRELETGEEIAYLVWWDDQNTVLRVDWRPGSGCTLHDAQSARQAVRDLGHPGAPLLVDMRGMRSFDRGAREHFTAGAGRVAAIAIVVGTPVTRMMANFFIGMRRAATPIKL